MKTLLASSAIVAAMSVASMASAATVTAYETTVIAPGADFGTFTLTAPTTITVAVDVSSTTPYLFGIVGPASFSTSQFLTSDFSGSYAVAAGDYSVSFSMFGFGPTGDFSVTYEVADVPTIPLPAAAPLLLAALGGLGFAARRKKKAA